MDDEDDDDMGTPPLEDPMPREHSLPPHLQNVTSYMRNASPPIQAVQNGVPYQRQHTPQAQMISRPVRSFRGEPFLFSCKMRLGAISREHKFSLVSRTVMLSR